MQKLKKSDIVVKSPGVQIRERIIEKYGEIKTFSEKINLYDSSIEQYLSCKNLGSSTFKIRLTNEMGKSLNELYLSDEDQIRKITTSISEYIELYNQRKDMELLEKIKEICIKREMIEDYAIVCRCYAQYFYNQKKIDRALAYMQLSVNYLRGREPIDRFAIYLSELIVIEAENGSKSKLFKWITECLNLLDQVIDPEEAGVILLNLGLAQKKFGNYSDARGYILKAISYLKSSRKLGFAYRCLGETEKLESNYELAYNHYLKAENYLESKDVLRIALDNEIALYHYTRHEFDVAESYIDQVIQKSKNCLSSTDNSYIITFTLVKSKMGKDEEIIREVRNLLQEISSNYIYAVQHIKLLEKIIEIRQEDRKFIGKIRDVLIQFYSSHDVDQDYDEAIKIILGRIMIELCKPAGGSLS
jgi:tetratricopeptide (TPR) repeat protein